MEKRTLLALALSFIVLASYPWILGHFYPQYRQRQAVPHDQKTPAALPSAASKTVSVSPAADRPFGSGKLELVFNKKGGVIRRISFPEYMDSEKHAPIQFISLEDPATAPTFVELVEEANGAMRDYEIGAEGSQVTAVSEGAVRITKRYHFDPGDYDGKLTIAFENTTDAPKEFVYRLYAGGRIRPRHAIDSQYIETNFFSKEGVRHVKETGAGKSVQSQGPVEWIAVKDRHFSVIVKPQEPSFGGWVGGLGHHEQAAALVSPKISVPPKGSVRHEFALYVGPNDIEYLEPLGFGALVNFGKLDGIGKLLVGVLQIFHGIFKNYGIAIILLTMAINLLFFPLTRVSYMSMKRMQLIQPQMMRLKEQYKKNPEKLNKEMMELYRKHKVNPFGGCLPMLLQMPVFIALYVALSKAVFLVNAKWLWIKDLSSPDSVPLPVALPFFGAEVHVLPLVMVAAMAIQQRFSQIKMEGQDPAVEQQQKMMAVMMPLLFGFIFYAMPSGLVLYWLTNTVLTSAYQWRLKKMTLT